MIFILLELGQFYCHYKGPCSIPMTLSIPVFDVSLPLFESLCMRVMPLSSQYQEARTSNINVCRGVNRVFVRYFTIHN